MTRQEAGLGSGHRRVELNAIHVELPQHGQGVKLLDGLAFGLCDVEDAPRLEQRDGFLFLDTVSVLHGLLDLLPENDGRRFLSFTNSTARGAELVVRSPI